MDKDIQELKRKAATGDPLAQTKLDRKLTQADIPQYVYVVTETHWDYNDQYYYPQEGEGDAVVAYRDIDAANNAKDEMELKRFKETFTRDKSYHVDNIGEYFHDWDVSEAWNDIPDWLAKKLGIDSAADLASYTIPADLPEEDIKALQKCLPISFFGVERIRFYG